MSLWVRLETTFWTHRKTIRLRAKIGDAAFWVPPRLWSYAAEHQPSGDFSDYSAEELAMLLAYAGDAQAMLEALQQAGFLDGMRLHGWDERNAYHSTFRQRAAKAAQARWQKKEAKKTVEERRGEERSIASSIAKQCLEHEPPPSADDFAEIPSEDEWVVECARYMIPKWYALKHFFRYAQQRWMVNRAPVVWREAVRYVHQMFHNDGRPMNPPGGKETPDSRRQKLAARTEELKRKAQNGTH